MRSAQIDQAPAEPRTPDAGLDKRLDNIGWGTLLIMLGAMLLVPGERVPMAAWLIATGLVLLALNVVRHTHALRVHPFGVVLGLFLVAAGVGDLIGAELPLFPIGLVIVGAGLILEPLLARTT